MKCTLNHGGGFYKVITAQVITCTCMLLFEGVGHCMLCNAVTYFWESTMYFCCDVKTFLRWNYFLVECQRNHSLISFLFAAIQIIWPSERNPHSQARQPSC